MDYRNFSPSKFYVDESLQPQGSRRIRTSTPRGRRPNPYQSSPDGGLEGTESPPSEGHWNKSWRHSNDSWKNRDSSRNSSFNSSFNSPVRYHGFRKEQDFNTSSGVKNIALYFHPSMLENPWRELEEKNSSESIENVSFNNESVGSSREVKINYSSDQEAHSPGVIIESVRDHTHNLSDDETSASGLSSSQKSS